MPNMRSRSSHVLAALSIALVLIACAPATMHQDPASLHNTFSQIFTRSGLPNLSVAIIRDGRLFWTAGFGSRVAGKDLPVDDRTIFQAASLSKPVFAVAVLKLVETGRIDLDRPLIEYIGREALEKAFLHNPMTDDRFARLTARHVLSHTTGLPNWRFFAGPDAPLAFRSDPGTQFGYSGEGFVMLQVARSSGSPAGR